MSQWNKTFDECGVYGCADDYEDAQKRKGQKYYHEAAKSLETSVEIMDSYRLPNFDGANQGE